MQPKPQKYKSKIMKKERKEILIQHFLEWKNGNFSIYSGVQKTEWELIGFWVQRKNEKKS